MKSFTRFASVAVFGLASVCGAYALAHDGDPHGGHDSAGSVTTVAFGAGLNTPPGSPQNHHVLPEVIRVKVGDVVNFAVAGFHIIRVYDRGVRVSDIKNVLPDECEVNPTPGTPFPSTCFAGPPVPVIPPLGLAVYYEGLNPLAPPATPPFAAFSTAQNRAETVLFSKPGRYLVICAVLPHFNEKMYAWVEVFGR
jgi:plastocyanin